MKLYNSFLLPLLLALIPQIKSQCPAVGCRDCFPWCPTQDQHCDQAIVKTFCRATCKACPPNNPACQMLNCEQRCLISEDLTSATCACFEGFELGEDGRTCNDIDECARDPAICDGTGATFCNNTFGEYACTSCKTYNNARIWSYYERDECCTREHSTQCGKSSTNRVTRIKGGRDARARRWPWTAYIDTREDVCGGTLITERHILTAAHCFESVTNVAQLRVTLGVVNVRGNGNIHVQTFPVAELHRYPGYFFPNHDVAILVLNRSVIISQYVYPACLPGGHQPQVGEICWATGYGTTMFRGVLAEVLQEVDLPIVNDSVCEQAYKKEVYRVNSTLHMCAGYVEGGKDACQGDSGGPLVCQRCNNCDWYIAGITSFGEGCGLAGSYGVYTRVVQYEKWITQITKLPFIQSECVKPSWHEWGPWTTCTMSCGTGIRSRTRFCQNGAEGALGCIGESFESVNCNQPPCNVISWSSWTTGSCSLSCGGGMRRKTRTCLNGNIGDTGCESGGESVEEDCNTQQCPQWRPFGSWSECSVTCGVGTRTSSRVCDTFGVEGASCDGKATRSESCRAACWSAYGEWSPCTVTCGGGEQRASRRCMYGAAGQGGCPGKGSRSRLCNTGSCAEWSEWSPCTATCGGGSQRRGREELSQQRDCHTQVCPMWGDYGSWSPCTAECGSGVRTATRRCINGRPGQPGCIGEASIEENCNTHACNAWTAWRYAECSQTCGGGQRSGSRICTGGIVPGVGCEGDSEVVEECNTQCCHIWGEYGPYNECSVSCGGGGMQVAIRTCSCGGEPSDACEGSDRTTRTCGEDVCPGRWSDYSYDGKCSVTCGNGTQRQRRECIGGTGPGGPGCEGSETRMVHCELVACPKWRPWSEYEECSETCGGGKQTRSRECIGGGAGGCIGNTSETRDCSTQTCPSTPNDICAGRTNMASPGDAQCCRLALTGYCQNYPTYRTFMQRNCARTCCQVASRGFCSSYNQCVDTTNRATCELWRSYNACNQVSTICAKTCGYCS